ncbi:MAG TPA: hypothetical protein VM324_16890 [Egibacteraceae bacterium]|nr:hypothetical protein [Egibacteraceae bacterium]
MAELQTPKSEALRALFWRSEILQVMYWLRGEGLGDEITPRMMERFLGVGAEVGVTYLNRLVEEGYLDRTERGFTLSPRGIEEGAAEFASSFAELTRPTHGECSADCWCHNSPEEADACAAERGAHSHSHDHDHDHDH